MRVQEENNSWDGFDKSEQVYDDRKEKSYQNRIWYVLLGVASLCLVILLGNHVKELKLLFGGQFIQAEYYESSSRTVANYRSEDGKQYTWDLTGFQTKVENGTVRLYYEERIGDAIALTAWWLWVFYYGFFGGMAGLCIWRIRRNG